MESMSQATDPELNKQAAYAFQSLPLAKPITSSIKQAYNGIFAQFSDTLKMSFNGRIGWLKSDKSSLPEEIFAFLKTNFAGINTDLFEVKIKKHLIQQLYKSLENLLRNKGSSQSPKETPFESAAYRFVKTVQDRMEFLLQDHDRPEADVFIRLFDNMQLYFSVNPKSVFKGFSESEFTSRLSRGITFETSKFINPVSTEVFVPSDIGLPVVAKISSPILNFVQADVKMKYNNASSYEVPENHSGYVMNASLNTNYKVVSKVTTIVKTLIPWSSSSVAAGVDAEKCISLPIKTEVAFKKEDKKAEFSATVAALTENKVPLVYAHNLPFTLIEPLMGGVDVPHLKNVKIIYVEKEMEPANEQQISLGGMAGLDLRLQYEGDVPCPFTTGRIYRVLSHPENVLTFLSSPTAKMWRAFIILDPSNSSTKIVRTSLVQNSEANTVLATLGLQGAVGHQYQVSFSCFSKDSKISTPGGFEVKMIPPQTGEHRSEMPAVCMKALYFTQNPSADHGVRREGYSPQELLFRIQVFQDSTCRDEAIASINGSLSSGSEQQLQKEQCSGYRTPAFDQASVAIQYEEERIPKELLSLAYQAVNGLLGQAFPFSSRNSIDVNNQNGHVFIDAKRSLTTGTWTLWMRMPREVVFIGSIPPVSNYLFSGESFRNIPEQLPLAVQQVQGSTCIVETGNVKTFDVVEYDYEPSCCYAIAIMNYHHPDRWVIMTRKSPKRNITEALLVDRERQMIIQMSEDELLVNGELVGPSLAIILIPDHTGHIYAEVQWIPNIVFTIPDEVSISIRKEINFTVSPVYKHSMCGLCGAYKDNRVNDLVGPKGCLYFKQIGHLYALAWTFPGAKECNGSQLEEKKNEVRKYQHGCPKIHAGSSVQAGLSSKFFPPSFPGCTEYIFVVRKESTDVCVSMVAVPKCRTDLCIIRQRTKKREPFKCWPKNLTPPIVLANLKRGYMYEEIADLGKSHKVYSITFDSVCWKK